MKSRVQIAVAILAYLSLSTSASGTGPEGARPSFYASGLGTLSCGKLLQATKAPVGRAQVADWINGYVTGYNYYATTGVLTPPENATSIAFAETFCRNNPLSNIVAAAAVLVQDLGGPKVAFKFQR